jgi:hypothetical protein
MVDPLTEEERLILAFVEAYLNDRGMLHTLAMLRNEASNVEELRSVLDGWRGLWERSLTSQPRLHASR